MREHTRLYQIMGFMGRNVPITFMIFDEIKKYGKTPKEKYITVKDIQTLPIKYYDYFIIHLGISEDKNKKPKIFIKLAQPYAFNKSEEKGAI